MSRRDPQVVVGVLTYRRPECLRRVLPLLVEQAAALGGRVVVVDNDPHGSAEQVVLAWSGAAVRYVHERRPGLAAARNRALDEARGADVLAFIDDDEVPAPDWLAELVRRWGQWRCAAVTGPVDAAFDGDVDPWILATGVFERRRRRTGTCVPGAATNNLLLDLGLVDSLNLRFDGRFELTGGEDTMFTHQLVRRGGSIRWCDEAAVSDPVPAHRVSRRWVLRRTFRAGTTWSRVAVLLADGGGRRTRERGQLTARALARIALGSARFARGVLSGDVRHRARGVCAVVSGAGMLAGAYGYTYAEYARRP